MEVKPKEFLNSDQMKIRKAVVENYISINGLDYDYWVFSEEELNLNREKYLKRKEIIKKNKVLNSKLRHYAKDDKFVNIAQKRFSSIPIFDSIEVCPKEYRKYIRAGKLPEKKWW